ncbi:MAG: transcriptional regulator MntR [Geminicoccaceae bacterium]|nr:MAG: transcriptional regulator MntR [Geminicoccaceae bacterium]
MAARRPHLVDPALQAASFDRIRTDHRSEIAEDYVELIADLIAAKGEARAVDLADRLGVSHATVNNTVSRLVRDGLVATEPYRSIFLTESGRELAEMAKRRHKLVVDFLEAIGVPAAIAHQDAEGIEHHVSDETLGCMEQFLADRGPA